MKCDNIHHDYNIILLGFCRRCLGETRTDLENG